MLAVLLWIVLYFFGSIAILTTIWAFMTLTCFLSILTLIFTFKLISSLNSQISAENQNELESGETVDPNSNPNFGKVKTFAQSLAVENLGIFACSLSYIILMFDCSIRVYTYDNTYDYTFFYDYTYFFDY